MVGALHCASIAAPSGGLDAFGLQTYGVTCGPAKTGPPIGWLRIVICRPITISFSCLLLPWCRLGAGRATSTFLPTLRPVTSPSYWPFSRTANAFVMSFPFRVTFTAAASALPRSMATSASPPEIRSARFDKTVISRIVVRRALRVTPTRSAAIVSSAQLRWQSPQSAHKS